MSKIKTKQIYAAASDVGKHLVVDGTGTPVWTTTTAASGSNTLLGTPTDGSFTNGAYTGSKPPAVSLSATETVADAVDAMNTIMGLLLPSQPTAFGGQTLTLTGTTTSLLVSGATDNTGGSIVAAGTTINRTTSAVSGTMPTQLGNGATGTLALYANGSAVSGENFTFTGSVGTTKSSGVLRVANVAWYPSTTPGFFESFDASVSGYSGPTGYNSIQIDHSVSGNSTTAYFVKDNLTSNPTVASVTVAQGSLSGIYSSGVQHYAASSTLTVGASLTNLAGQCYVATPLSVSGPGTTLTNPGLTLPLAANTLSSTMSNQSFTVSGNHHQITNLTVTATNPNGSANSSSTTNLLIKSGTTNGDSGKIYEEGITAKATTATRVYLTNGTNTNDTPTALTNSAWTSTQLLNAAGYLQEATIVGGILKNDLVNYSTGYLPVGPNYSSKSASQYVTYMFSQAAVSSITLNITGTYSHFWVGLPGVSDNNSISPNALNGVWWDGFTLYNGAGVPGRSGDSGAGCATGTVATGTTGNYTLTFGTQSSSNSTSNAIYVRIKLTSGQSITALSIS